MEPSASLPLLADESRLDARRLRLLSSLAVVSLRSDSDADALRSVLRPRDDRLADVPVRVPLVPVAVVVAGVALPRGRLASLFDCEDTEDTSDVVVECRLLRDAREGPPVEVDGVAVFRRCDDAVVPDLRDVGAGDADGELLPRDAVRILDWI